MATPSFIAPSTPLDRRHLGKYEVLCRLSTGGMSAIYLAHQTGLAGFKKLVVLKTILPDIGGEEDFVGMFLEEARITAAFNHPNIAQVFELETDDGQLFMAMEFVQGCTLVEMARACRQAREPIPLGFTLATVRDTALALHYAHNFTDARGRKQIVIHRDVAEKNIMVTYEGVTKLLDFGIAKALGRSGRTSIGMVKGTSGYMSPEQIRGEPLDSRSDVFALGVVMHECLTGLRLFHGKTAEEGMMAALREEVQPPSKWNREVTPDLDAVVMRALERDRERRFGSALEFARAIEKAAPGLLWHPEQLGEVVTRHFADRRIETRRLLEGVEFGSEITGEIRVKNVMAQVRASMAQLPQASGETKKPSGLVAAPRQATAPPVNESTRPGVNPLDLSTRPPPMLSPTVEPQTSPARPRALRASSNPGVPPPPVGRTSVTTPEPALVRNAEFDDDDDSSGDKTIPAAALPEEIKNLRAQFATARKVAAQAQQQQMSPGTDGARAPEVSTEPQKPALEIPRTVSGETLSITGQNASPLAWDDDDDDDGAKTAIAGPNDIPGLAAARAARKAQQQATHHPPPPVHEQSSNSLQPLDDDEPEPPTSPSAPDLGSMELEPPRRAGLVVVLVILALLAVLGILVLLDVVPIPRLG